MRPRDVLALRLASQHLSGPPAATPLAVVESLPAVQAQDAPLARLAIAQRAAAHTGDVAAAADAGVLVRTHVLRPTWHYVAVADLPWLLELTGPRLVSGTASRLQRLGLTAEVLPRALDAVASRLGQGPATRAELADLIVAGGILPRDAELGMRITHVLMQAEAHALVASGPLRAGEHTYRLWETPAPGRDRADAVAELVRRFVVGHGPSSVRDILRWANVTKREVDAALAAAGLASTTVDGVVLHHADADTAPGAGWAPTLLLSTFDEVFLSHSDLAWPRAVGHPLADAPYRWSEAGGGPILDALADVGTWRRTLRPGRLTIRLDLATSLSVAARRRVAAAAEDAASRLAPPDTTLTLEEGPVPFGVRSPRSLSTRAGGTGVSKNSAVDPRSSANPDRLR